MCFNVSLFVDCSTEAPSGCSSNLQSKDGLYQHPSRRSAGGDAVSQRRDPAFDVCMARFVLDAQLTFPVFVLETESPSSRAWSWALMWTDTRRLSSKPFQLSCYCCSNTSNSTTFTRSDSLYLPLLSLLVSLWCLWPNWPCALQIGSLSKHHSSHDNERERARERQHWDKHLN